jgi:Ser/Thr protein kinase RdoA (MazF antagonist)
VPSAAARRLAGRFGLADGLVSLGAFESEVLASEGARGPTVLKVIDPRHRQPHEVEAEVDWLLALAGAGVRVARPVPTAAGAFVVTDETAAIGVAYERAPGRHLAAPEWTPQLVAAHGELLGQLHAHARGWTPPRHARRSWRDTGYLGRADDAWPGDTAFAAAVAELTAATASLDALGDEGTVHADLHTRNLLVDDDGAITAIDFDDAVVAPFGYDLAIPLYYAVAARPTEDAAQVADRFLTSFLAGFDRVAPRPRGGASAAALALSMRQADLAVALRVLVPPGDARAGLRDRAARLRDLTVAGQVPVPLDLLRDHLGDH